jgi:hypothetical protein
MGTVPAYLWAYRLDEAGPRVSAVSGSPFTTGPSGIALVP